MSGARLHLERLRLGYATPAGVRTVVDGLSLALDAGEAGCLLGASGCGKTTVLRAVAGFQPLLAGSIRLDDEAVATERFSLPPERRRIGLMFQDYALFPHLSVAANVGFGLRGVDRQQRRRRVSEMLSLVGLDHRAGSYPHELSGGQQQRVALARALAPQPRLLLLDEPFSNLDVDTRQQLASELRTLLKATATTVLMVTHDQTEAFAMADRIGYMSQGKLLQWDRPDALYHRPADREVAQAIGRGVLLPAAALGLDGDDEVLVRSGQLCFDADGPVTGEVASVFFRGPAYVARVLLGRHATVDVELPGDFMPGPGASCRLRLTGTPAVRFPR